jgi:hypothetical protein
MGMTDFRVPCIVGYLAHYGICGNIRIPSHTVTSFRFV